MIVEVCAIRDRLTGFGSPQFEYSVDSAKRNFSDAVKKDSQFGEHIHDFSLYRLGSFDTDNGLCLIPDVPELICTAFDVTGGVVNDSGTE